MGGDGQSGYCSRVPPRWQTGAAPRHLGPSELQSSYPRALYGHLRALTEGYRKAAKIVRLVKGDNGLEAWRRLTRKLDPQNPDVHAAQLEHIVMFGNRNPVKQLGDVPIVLDQFQRILDDYEEATGDVGINDQVKKTVPQNHDAAPPAVPQDGDA